MPSLTPTHVVMLLLVGGIAVASDPFEVNPMQESIVVDAKWGDGPGEFDWRGDEWGLHMQVRFGPFTLDEQGKIYIADLVRNEVKIYNPGDGSHFENVPMLKEHNLVDDLAVYSGKIYWLGDAVGGMRLLSVDSGSRTLSEFEIAMDPEQCFMQRGSKVYGLHRLVVTPEGINLHTRLQGFNYPLVRNEQVLSPEEQLAAKSQGLKRGGSVAIVKTLERTIAASGESVGPGDIVSVSSDGQILDRLLRYGSLCDAAGDYFLVEVVEKVQGEPRSYWALYDSSVKLLSRTRMPQRDTTREVRMPNPVRLEPDGSWYQLYVDDSGVHVARFR